MQNKELLNILNDVRLYPSPHNSQPIRVFIENDKLKLYYDLKRGLPAESFGKQFGFVCFGVFLSALKTVCANYGYSVKETLDLTEMDFGGSKRLHFLGSIDLLKNYTPSQEDKALYDAYLNRQTSRIAYNNKLISRQAIAEASAIAKNYGQALTVLSDADKVKSIIDINQKTLFLDIANDAVYDELMEWLRFSDDEAKNKGDGLSAKTMLIHGGLLKLFMKHRQIWNYPLIGNVIKAIYLNTMRGVRQVAWLSGDFKNHNDYVTSGKCFMEIWVTLTKFNIYLHPYGTVITNQISHKQFTDLIGQNETNGQMAWMLFRLGYSKQPPKSYRRPLNEMLLTKEDL